MLLGDFNQSHFLLIFDFLFYARSALEQEHHNLIYSVRLQRNGNRAYAY